MFTNNLTIEHANFPEISSPVALSEIEPTMSRSDFSGSEFQELMAEFVSTTIVDSRNVAMDHNYHKPVIIEESNNAANQPQRSGDEGSSEILNELRCISPINSIPDISNEIEVMDDEDSISNVQWNSAEHEIWKELRIISPDDLLEDPFAAKPPLSQIQGNFLENHKMDYFGK